MKPKKIILVFKTHFDIGFTDLSSRVIDNYAKGMLEEVIETCRKTRDMGKLRYVWTMPAWPLWHIAGNCAPDLKKELDALIENGQVAWHALPFTSHTDFCSQKEYLEGLKYSRLLAELYRKPCPVSAKMTDVPGHSIMLPDLLHQAGIRFLHLGCNEFATPPQVPGLFFWEGPGKRRVLNMYSPGGYGTGLAVPEDWPFPVWMALMHTHDNKGPQSADAIRKLAEQAKTLYPDAEVVCGTMDDFYRELAECELSGVPVVTGDLADTWIHGVGAYPSEVSQIRRTRREMEGLQALWLGKWMAGEEIGEAEPDAAAGVKAEEAAAGRAEAPEWTAAAGQCLEQYYEQISLFEEHTWGADVKTWLGPDRVYEKEDFLKAKDSEACRFMERSWEEQRERAGKAAACVEELEELLEPEELPEAEELPESDRTGAEEDTRWLFCGEEQPHTGWVRLPGEWEGSPILVDGAEAVCGWVDGNWCCYVENLPGFTSVPVRRMKKNEAEAAGALQKKDALGSERAADDILSLENHRYRLMFCGKTGAVISLWDKKLQTALLKGDEHRSALAYQYDKYGYDDINEYLRSYGYHFTTWGIQDYGRENYPFCPHETFIPAFVRFELTKDTVRLFYSSQGDGSARRYGNAEEMELSITLPVAGDEIFIGLSLKNKQETPYVESGSFRLLPGEKPLIWRMQKGGALFDPETEVVKNANHSLYCLENGMAAFGKRAGFCLKTPDAPLVSLNGTGIYHFAPEFEAAENGGIYVSLFNNMWGTNFPQWMGGSLRYSFVLEGLLREEEKELSVRLDRSPEGVRLMRRSLGTLPLKLPEGMRLIGVDPEERGMLVQLAETAGVSSARTLTAAGCRITPVDLYGRVQGETEEDRYTFDAAAFGVQAFLLERAGAYRQEEGRREK